MQLRRGLKGSLPAVAKAGEPLITTDTQELYVGTGSGVKKISDIVVATSEPAVSDRSKLWVNPLTNLTFMFVNDAWQPINSDKTTDFGSF
jgi:hypothetical protein